MFRFLTCELSYDHYPDLLDISPQGHCSIVLHCCHSHWHPSSINKKKLLQSLPVSAVFEWRSEYTVDLVEAQGGDLEVLTIVTTVNLVIL